MSEPLTDAQKVLRNDTGKRIAVALEALASEVDPSTVIAPEYDETQTYAVGDLVIYRSVLYRLTTAITTPEEWTAAHWTAVTVADELADKYVKPTGGIPKNDLAAGVQESLEKADTALQSVPSTYRTAAAQDVIDSGLTDAINNKMNIFPASIEIVPPENAGHGGYIDFHFNGNSGDYTSRIIEDASGHLNIPGSLSLGLPLPVASGGTGNTTVDTKPTQNSTKMVTSGGVHNAINRIPKQNLLDNWDFGNPVNQRGLNTYQSDRVCFDRWVKDVNSHISKQSHGGYAEITIVSNDPTIDPSSILSTNLSQQIENPYQFSNRTVTLSAMANGPCFLIIVANGAEVLRVASPNTGNVDVFSISAVVPAATNSLVIYVQACGTINTVVDLYAVKLELGSEQTLAHQETDSHGVTKWVLNEIADFSQELLKCQRYFQTFRTEALRPTYGADCRPVMASDEPTTGTITINGVTYYTLEA